MSFILTLVKLLKQPRTLVIVLLGLLLLLLFTLGAKLGVGMLWRLIIGGVLVVICVGFAWLLGNLSGEAPVASGEDSEGCHRSFRVRHAVVVLQMDRHSGITVCTEDGTEEELLRDVAEHLLRRAGV